MNKQRKVINLESPLFKLAPKHVSKKRLGSGKEN
jgi:hypothetical protein